MAQRPWVTPEDIKSYTDIPAVLHRDDAKLKMDIIRAENYIIKYTNNDFGSSNTTAGKPEGLPEGVRMAVILLAERYAYKSSLTGEKKKSETFDDYSYTLENREIDLSDLDLPSLLDDYIQEKDTDKGRVTMKLRLL